MDALVGDALRSYSRYWLETFRLPKMDNAEVVARVDATAIGVEHLDAALDRGRGAVVALPHMGNWDVAGLWLVDHTARSPPSPSGSSRNRSSTASSSTGRGSAWRSCR